MHYIDPHGREFASLGTVDGEIAGCERGELGFSFDPVFTYVPAGRTFAELTDVDKNRVSHRAIAAAAIVAAIDAAAVRLAPE
jgi:XTP/dITP diphosphohydrolase